MCSSNAARVENPCRLDVCSSGDIAGDFEVLLLILSHRHDIAVVNQNVGCHQNRVGEQAGGRWCATRDLILVRMRELKS